MSDTIRVSQLRLPPGHAPEELQAEVLRRLRLAPDEIAGVSIARRSIDARQKENLLLVYTVDVLLRSGVRFSRRLPRNAVIHHEPEYEAPSPGRRPMEFRPLVVGAGPAGLFAALRLALSGYRPLLLERGRPVAERIGDVARFWASGELDPESNMQFGEGGAGTFSDGKLTSGIRDLRCRWVLEQLVAAGAPGEILSDAKPHVGTDRLRQVVVGLRRAIVAAGGEVRFHARVEGIETAVGALRALQLGDGQSLPAHVAVLAIGHSARDTYARLFAAGLAMEAKPLAVGLRIEHPQAFIDQVQYGRFAGHPALGAADYKLTADLGDGRAAYTFCMCPGGYVVGAASEPGGVVTNGMSDQARNHVNANSALLVTVTTADFPTRHPLAGIDFQRRWEQMAFAAGGGGFAAPVQRVDDFLAERRSIALGDVPASYRPGVSPADFASCLPPFVCSGLRGALRLFERRLPGFARPDAVLTGVETRSSAPLRICRDAGGESPISGLFPAGEGAGYAGGIMSSAVDGMRAAEAIICRYAPPR